MAVLAAVLRSARVLTPGRERPGRRLRQLLIACWLVAGAVTAALALGYVLLTAGLPAVVLVPLVTVLAAVALLGYGALFALLPALLVALLGRYAGGRRARRR